ncbi:OmpA family protein [Flavobacterium sp. J27]|uniref:OmpA family protein n=1 Tax=Flavobacterium sp. J27 TaxID=2060419 RepID=UPI0010307B14|nr:OmpA family protein [Flavobacterium sp. J27]
MKEISIIICYFICFLGYSQKTNLAIADKKYEKYAYIDAIKIYEKVAEKGYESPELFQKLGNAYYFNSEFEPAAKWYKKLFSLQAEQQAAYYYRYYQSLKSLEKYDEANKYLALYNLKTNNSSFNNNSNFEEILEKKSNYIVQTTTINTAYYDFNPSYYKDQIVFTSSRPDLVLVKKTHNWTNQNFTDFYVARVTNDSILSEPENFSSTINSKFNEASAIFTKDGKTMYFTRNNFLEGKKGRDKGIDKNRTTLLKVYKASFINAEWTNIKELPFNSDTFSTAHPALSEDEKTLYFVSDRPGTLGGADIFKVAIKGNNQYGKPENLGPVINTSGRETFPFIGPEGNLYFASDGHLGLGGLDIFEAKKEKDIFLTPVNMGKPINSSKDDFSLITKDKQTGYLTSNREGGLGFDDIYFFKICTQTISGIVTDSKTNEILTETSLYILDEHGNQIDTLIVNKEGKYEIELDCNTKYFIRTYNEDFETLETPINPITANTTLNLQLNRNIFPFEIGTDLAKVFDISIIYFDLDKWNIRPDAARDIQKVIEVMKEYPKMHVAIQSHTDSRETHRYNELLSDRRAKSTLQFMVANGIEIERLTATGYGETRLVNECADGVYCSEEDHQKNRRSEFIVTKIE